MVTRVKGEEEMKKIEEEKHAADLVSVYCSLVIPMIVSLICMICQSLFYRKK